MPGLLPPEPAAPTLRSVIDGIANDWIARARRAAAAAKGAADPAERRALEASGDAYDACAGDLLARLRRAGL